MKQKIIDIAITIIAVFLIVAPLQFLGMPWWQTVLFVLGLSLLLVSWKIK